MGPWVHPRRSLALPALLLLLLCLPVGCRDKGAQLAAPPGVPTIRVRLLENQTNVVIAASEAVGFTENPGVSPRPLNVPKKTDVPVLRTASGWRVGQTDVQAPELTLLPLGDGGHLSINGKPYRGNCRLVPVGPDNRFDVVNDVDLEGYLKGVLAKELWKTWHEETFRAQAIIARTYALYEMKTSGLSRHWDVYSNTNSQMYGGITGESSISRSATDDTIGVVVAFGPVGQEKIFKAYFSSCCGGITQSNADAFGEFPQPPLMEQNFGNRCNASPRFNWGPVVISKEELTRRLRRWGANRGRAEKNMATVARVDIAHANRFGRPVRFTVTDTRGQRYSLGGTELRHAVNSSSGTSGIALPSSFVTPADDDLNIRFVDGHGFGHGVGMCQYCAQAQAEAGEPHEKIVLSA
jgi:stage II sporulation protein D